MNVIEVIRTNVYLQSLSLLDVYLDCGNPNREECDNEYVDTIEGDIGSSIAVHPSIHTVELLFRHIRCWIYIII